MKVGILTYHGAHNYGSALQAYALYRALTSEGHQAALINYRTDRQDALYQLYNAKPTNIMGVLRNLHSFAYSRQLKEHHMKFDQFLAENAELSGEQIRNPDDLKLLNGVFDCFICGSDQIWNPNCIDFDVSYLLSFVEDKNTCFSYAPSIAADRLDSKWHEVFRNELKNYSDLSVREKSGAAIISALTDREVNTVLDPVFLLEKSSWDYFCKGVSKDYILCYFIGDIPGMRNYAIALSRKYKKPIIVINKYLRDLKMKCEKQYNSGPIDFVNLVANAEAICTNSFHAVAFSLIYDKEFHAFVDNKHVNTARSRITDLLESLNMSDRIVTNCHDLLPAMSENSFMSHNILDCQIRASKRYLHNALNKIEMYRARGNV